MLARADVAIGRSLFVWSGLSNVFLIGQFTMGIARRSATLAQAAPAPSASSVVPRLELASAGALG